MTLWGLLSAPFRRGPRQPLAARQPHRAQTAAVPLGMEATDLDLIAQTQRRNDALERVIKAPAIAGLNGWTGAASTDVAPLPDDETYAAHYHRAYQRKETSK